MQSLCNFSNIKNERVAIVEHNSKYTYKQLSHDVQELSAKIRSIRKQLVLILAQNNYQSIVNYLAVLQNNDAVMFVNADLEESLIHSIITSYQPAIILGNINHEDYFKVNDKLNKRTSEPSYEIHQDLALLLSTSGTTGSIKFVRLSYKNLLANAKSISEYLKITHEDRGMANPPISYSYGLSIINSHLYAGATILLTSDSVLTKDFWDLVRNEMATSLAGVPYTYQMLQRIGFHKMELPHIRYFTQAGGRLNEKLVRLFGDYAKASKKEFFVMYGQTEATARMSFVPPEILLEKSTSIGKAIPNGELGLDPDSNELIYKGPNVMMGYATTLSDLAKGDELQEVLHTGDIAEMDSDGYFYIKGRMKRFIKLFGLRLNLDDIEKRIESTLNINVVCVGTDDRMFVIVPIEEKIDEIQSLIETLYKLHRSAFRVKVVEDIPRLVNGKVNYEALKDLVI